MKISANLSRLRSFLRFFVRISIVITILSLLFPCEIQVDFEVKICSGSCYATELRHHVRLTSASILAIGCSSKWLYKL